MLFALLPKSYKLFLVLEALSLVFMTMQKKKWLKAGYKAAGLGGKAGEDRIAFHFLESKSEISKYMQTHLG